MKRSLPETDSADPVGTLAGRVAAEIGTALTAIGMAVDRLERQAGEENGAAELAAIRMQSGRLSRLARQLLALARPPAAARERLELNQEVERTLGPFRRRLERRGIELRFRPCSEEVAVQGDPNRLREILLALLGNAERASRSEPGAGDRGWVEVRVIPGRFGGGEVRIRDSGPGVSEETEDLIFVPFVSGWGGEGMGLPISRLSAIGQGGTLGLERDVGGRCEFVFRLEPFGDEVPR
jgi:signal transduction histidine kinase